MIIRLEFNRNTPSSTLDSFLQKPKGTCLHSSSAQNITPKHITARGQYVSFWFIEDKVLNHFYGGKVAIYSLLTFPGIIGASEILRDNEITLHTLTYKLSKEELSGLLEPFL